MGKIILVKNNKGGVGKSWITLQLAHTIAEQGKDVLILTSDSQNNILDFSGKRDLFSENTESNKHTLDYQLSGGFGNWHKLDSSKGITLREGLQFMPLNSLSITYKTAEKFKEFISYVKMFYHAVIIDATPVLGLDDCFVEVADKIVVPTYLDTVTTGSIANMVNSVGGEKIKVVIPNRFNRTKIEKEIYKELEGFFMPTQVLLTVPMKQSSLIGSLIDSGKTIHDTKSSKVTELRELFKRVVEELMEDE